MKQKPWRLTNGLLTPEELIELAQQQRAITKVTKDLSDLLKELEQMTNTPAEQFTQHEPLKNSDGSNT